MIKFAYLFLEILTYLLIVNELCGKKFSLNFPAAITIFTEILLLSLGTDGYIPEIFLYVPYILIFFYCKIEFNLKVTALLLNILLAFMTMGCLQLMVGFLSFFIENDAISAVIINFITLIISLLLIKYKILSRIFQYIKRNSKTVFYIVLYCGLLLIFILICYFIFGKFSFFEYVLIISVYLLLIGMLCIWKREKDNLNYKKNELDVFQKYYLEEKQLYNEIRKKQHEFKNQLSAIYSTHYTCSTYEELVLAQRKYADWIIKDNQYSNLLLRCKPSVLAGFIYSQLEYAKQQEIEVDYTINIIEIVDTDVEYDYICVFGVLFDNAVEAVKDNLGGKRKIDFTFYYDGLCTKLMVNNICSYVQNKDIEMWFVEKYSTKGNSRGYGLSNVMKIKEKYNANIVVENIDKEQENWISICFIINQ